MGGLGGSVGRWGLLGRARVRPVWGGCGGGVGRCGGCVGRGCVGRARGQCGAVWEGQCEGYKGPTR